MIDTLQTVGVVVLVPLALAVGVVVGIVVCVLLKREELRSAQRGVEEARAMLVEAGLWPPAPEGVGPVPATPTSDREEVSR